MHKRNLFFVARVGLLSLPRYRGIAAGESFSLLSKTVIASLADRRDVAIPISNNSQPEDPNPPGPFPLRGERGGRISCMRYYFLTLRNAHR